MRVIFGGKIKQNIIAVFMAIAFFVLSFSLSFAEFTGPITYKKHDGYASIIIDWNNDFNYKTVVKKNVLYISFDREYAKGFSEIKTKLSGYVSSYFVSKDFKNIKIIMNNEYIVRDYFENKKLYIDIIGKETKLIEKPDFKNTENKKIKSNEQIKKIATVVSPKIEKIETVIEEVKKVDVPDEENVSEDVKDDATVSSIKYGEEILFVNEGNNKDVKIEASEEDKQEEKVEVLGSMSFSWDHPTHSAVFRKDGYLWAVFDRKKDFDVKELVGQVKSIVDFAVIIPHSKITVIRMVTRPNVYERVRKEKLLWIVDFVEKPVKLSKSIDVQTQYSDFDGFKLHLNVNNAGKVYSLVDPEIGDEVFVVPVVDSSYSVPLKYDLPDLELLNSSQGVVIIPKNDKLKVISTSRLVDVYIKDEGLSITSDAEQIANMIKYMKDGNVSQPFNLKLWARSGRTNFANEVASLRSVISKWDKEKADVPRLELARYYAANGYGAEALGVLSLVKEKNKSMENDVSFRAVRGLSNFLMQRYDEALKDFSYGNLLDNDEAVLWRHIIELVKNPNADLNSIILSYAGYIKTYPSDIKTKIYLLASYVALAAGDELTLRNYIREIGADKSKSNNQFAEYYYLISKYDILSGNYNSAIRNLEKVLEFNSKKFSAYARKDLAMMKYEMARGKIKNAIVEFERLKYIWREPKYEKLVLNYLAMLYDKDKSYIEELRILDNIKNIFGAKDPELEESTLKRMKSLYFDLFVEGKADVYSPIQYLGLFEEFKWLLPAGKKGLEVAQAVSDRLVGVDLLDKAADLLKEQITISQAEGEDKLRFGARLALVYLLDNHPDLAIEALDDTEELNIENKNLYIQRKLIRARSLADLGKTEKAIAMIKNNKERDAVVLKSEIYWDAKNWDEAANTIRDLIEKPEQNSKISDEQAQYILDWITALKMSGRSGVIAKIRYKFLPYFNNTKYFTEFNLLTGDLKDDNINMKSISSLVDNATRFGAFVRNYYDKIKKEGLSQTLQ